LPLHVDMTAQDIEMVVSEIKDSGVV